MRVIGTDKNGDEIVEASATELDTMFKETRNNTIDEFAERLKAESFSGYATLEDYCEDTVECVAVEDIDEIVEQLKVGGKNE